MDHPVQLPGFEGREVFVRVPSVFDAAKAFKGPELWVDGQAAAKGSKKGQYFLKRGDGQEVLVKLKTSIDPTPVIEIEGKKVQVVAPLKWYQVVWSCLPIILLTGGMIGGVVGALALMFNIRLFREDIKPGFKYLLSGAVSFGAFMFCVIIVLWLRWKFGVPLDGK